MDYIDYEVKRAFEKRIGWKNIMAQNVAIGKFLKFKPEIEYTVSNETSVCYSPKNVSSQFSYPEMQKIECDRWLQENKEKYPESWVQKENFKTTMQEWYPQFHLDWNHLMEAIKRLQIDKGVSFAITPDIFSTWETVVNMCEKPIVVACQNQK